MWDFLLVAGRQQRVNRGTAIIILRKYGICEAIKTSLTLQIFNQLPIMTQGVGGKPWMKASNRK